MPDIEKADRHVRLWDESGRMALSSCGCDRRSMFERNPHELEDRFCVS